MKILGKIFQRLQKPAAPEKEALPDLHGYLVKTATELVSRRNDPGGLSAQFTDANSVINTMMNEGRALVQVHAEQGNTLSDEEALLQVCDRWREKHNLPALGRNVTYKDGDAMILFYQSQFRIL